MQKTFHGQTAGGLLKTARVVQMQAGNYEIVINDKRGHEYVIFLTIDGSLLLTDSMGVLADLQPSDAALQQVRALTERAEYKMGQDIDFYF